MKKKKNIKEILRDSASVLFLIISLILVIAISWYQINFSDITLEELIFHLKVPLANTNTDFIGTFIKDSIDYFLLVFLVIGLIIYQTNLFKHKYQYNIKINIFKIKKEKTIKIKDDRNHIFVINLLILIASIGYSLYSLNIVDYIKNSLHPSTIFENYYVDPRNVKLEFPEKKQNLIYIYLESMETNFSNITNPGVSNSNLIPHLKTIADNNINFSHNEELGGAYQAPGTSWTIAAMVSHTAGIPLKISIEANSLDEYSEFLPGAYVLGDILKENGYRQYLMVGSDSTFGGRRNYFTQHGNYEIFDYLTAIETKKIDKDYFVWWGYEDQKLFEYAKEKLTNISKSNEPFNFTLLTVDTHFTEGYTDSSCNLNNENSYANAVECSDIKIYEFLNWLKEQDFYENTTIIITGDHLLMGNYLYPNTYKEERHIYNAIINSKTTTENTKNRVFTTLDMFPTTLASIGVKIEGNRLGLGTNLFSPIPTLSEELGKEKFQNQLSLKSNYYNNNILYPKNKQA